jgi:hypothetical protein
MLDIRQKLKQYGSLFHTGLLKSQIPGIAGGFINELFHQWHVDVDMVTQYVQNNQSLWGKLSPETRSELSIVAERVGTDFVTPDFLITSIRKDFPSVASLLVSWPEAAEWLERQIKELKDGVSGESQEKID